MTDRKTKIAVFAAILAVGGALAVSLPAPVQAQSSRDMSVLSDEQRAQFNARLQGATSSADRARITSELNRAIQQRKMELRREERQKQSGKK